MLVSHQSGRRTRLFDGRDRTEHTMIETKGTPMDKTIIKLESQYNHHVDVLDLKEPVEVFNREANRETHRDLQRRNDRRDQSKRQTHTLTDLCEGWQSQEQSKKITQVTSGARRLSDPCGG